MIQYLKKSTARLKRFAWGHSIPLPSARGVPSPRPLLWKALYMYDHVHMWYMYVCVCMYIYIYICITCTYMLLSAAVPRAACFVNVSGFKLWLRFRFREGQLVAKTSIPASLENSVEAG